MSNDGLVIGGVTLSVNARLDVREQGVMWVELRAQSADGVRLTTIPFSLLTRDQKLRDKVADQFGIAVESPGQLSPLRAAAQAAPLIIGTSRLGWTSDREAFVLGATVLSRDGTPSTGYRFLGPPEAEMAFFPKGDKKAQYDAFRQHWKRSGFFRLVLSLVASSPFLELLGTPTVILHIAGKSGLGKTTLVRLAISAFADPNAGLMSVDLSKDSFNSADQKLGQLHNFPILLDETTNMKPKKFEQAMYDIAVGRSKARLLGADDGYTAAQTLSYTLACFVCGENPREHQIKNEGAAARFIEIKTKRRLIPEEDLPHWYEFAGQHFGWFGRNLIKNVLVHEGEKGLRQKRDVIREAIRHTDFGHSRTVEALTTIALGYFLASMQLRKRWRKRREADELILLRKAVSFARRVNEGLPHVVRRGKVVAALAGIDGIENWLKRGFVPRHVVDAVLRELDMDDAEVPAILRKHKLVGGVQPRKIDGKSQRCYIFTTKAAKIIKKKG